MRRSLLQGVDLRPMGYKILLEVLLRTRQTVHEVPYRFSEREADTSKANLRQGEVFLRHCGRLAREIPSAGIIWKLSLTAAIVGVARLLRRPVQTP